MPRDAELVYISSSAIRTDDPVEAISLLLPLTTNIELTGGCAYDERLLPQLVASKTANKVNLLLHNYFPPPREHFVLNFADTGRLTRDFITRAMEYVLALNVPYYSVHAGFRGDFVADGHGLLQKQSDRTFTWEGIRDNVSWFRSKWPHTPLVLENIYPNNRNTACAFMMSDAEIGELLDRIPEIFLLLDLGHLQVSAQLMGFDFSAAVATLFRRFGRRIMELHLSENHGLADDHLPIYPGSPQQQIVREYAEFIRNQAIRVTIETRASMPLEIANSYELITQTLYGHHARGHCQS